MTLTEKARAGFASITLRGGRITKWKGRTASYSPQLGHLSVGVSGVAIAAALALTPSAAEAGTCTESAPNSGVWVCAGPANPATDTQQSMVNYYGPVSVTTLPGFGISSSGDSALLIDASNGVSFLDINASVIIGQLRGIEARHLDGNSMTIVSNGRVEATNSAGIGINAETSNSGENLSITSNITAGGATGIRAVNEGTGSLTVTSTGSATGTNFAGISASTSSFLSYDVTVNANNTSGGVYGIRALIGGSGNLVVNSTGTARGTAAVGIFASTSNAYGFESSGISVTANNSEGGVDGIRAQFGGYGQLQITSTGQATGTAGNGISATTFRDGQNMPQSTGLAISAANTTGGQSGIRASHDGFGLLSITSSGTASGGAFAGITATNGEAGYGTTINANTATGGDFGIQAIHNGYGSVSITSDGTASGTNTAGISASNSARGEGLTIEANDASGGVYGIVANNQGSGALSITATGTASGGTFGIAARNEGTDLTIAANRVTGGVFGIRADNNGSGALSITATGAVNGSSTFGISADNRASATDLTISTSDVTGGIYGIRAQNDGTGALSITATGTASGGTFGISARNEGTDLTIAAGIVTGGVFGIRAVNDGTGALSITATGAVTGSSEIGMLAENAASGTDLTISAGDVTGGNVGIRAGNAGTGTLSITSTGTVTGGNIGIDAEVVTGNGLTINTNNVTGGLFGIRADNGGTGALAITSTGTLRATTGNTLEVLQSAYGGDVTIDINDAIGAGGIRIFDDASGKLSFTARGTVSETGSGAGIFVIKGAGSIDLTANNSTGINVISETDSVNITSTGVANAGMGIRLVHTGGDATVNAATTTGTENGMRIQTAGPGTLRVTSSVSATASIGDGIRAQTAVDAGDMIVTAVDTYGRQSGIRVLSLGTGSTSITSTGTASGFVVAGITAENASTSGSLTISANDASGGRYGIRALNNGTGALAITATGRVQTTAPAESSFPTGGAGVWATNEAGSTDITIDVNDAAGARNGIRAVNRGTGSTTITARGLASGAGTMGIYAFHAASAGSVTVDANDTSGGARAILVRNDGTGAISITSTGTASGGSISGISAFNTAIGTSIAVTAKDVSGDGTGIFATNEGTGSLAITSTGLVEGRTGTSRGINAENRGTSLTISANDVRGGSEGILARNFGSGALSITAAGTVTGANGTGISAENAATGTDLAIAANEVVGAAFGISARQRGTGAFTIYATNVSATGTGILADRDGEGGVAITSTGSISTTGNLGINVVTATSPGTVTVAVNDVTAALRGIVTSVVGGPLSISSTGLVRATDASGIGIDATTQGASFTVAVNDVSAGATGIDVVNEGTGALAITATGLVQGTGGFGILAENRPGATDLSIAAADVSGGVDGIRALNFGSGALSIAAIGTVAGTSGMGINALNLADDRALTITAGDVFGNFFGIRALQNSAGALTIDAANVIATGTGISVVRPVFGDVAITSTGRIIGATGAGIQVTGTTGPGDVTIAVNDVTGSTAGIQLGAPVIGRLSIASTGTVEATGTGSFGIQAAGSGGSIDVAVNAVRGGETGIEILNEGTGALTIAATGPVTGVTRSGIEAVNAETAAGLTIDAADVSGGTFGISARHYGSDALTITASGAVAGTSVAGISGFTGSAATGLAITANDTRGSLWGIRAEHNGSGALSIISTGTASGDDRAAILALAEASATDLAIAANNAIGNRRGIEAVNFGTGALTITATGTVIGSAEDGIFALNSAAGTSLGITAFDVVGGLYGINARNEGRGALSITTTGSVQATLGTAIRADNFGSDLTLAVADVSGPQGGIRAALEGGGALSITATGSVQGGTGSGIVATNGPAGTDLTITANNTSGYFSAIEAFQEGRGALVVNSTGTAQSALTAIQAYTTTDSTTASITARDTSGGDVGILAVHNGSGELTITSTGTATGTSYYGIVGLSRGSGLTISAADVSGGRVGIYAINAGSGAVNVTSTGRVEATGPSLPYDPDGAAAISVQNGSSGTSLTIAAVDTRAARWGIRALNSGTGALTITSAGLAEATGAFEGEDSPGPAGIYALNGGTASDLAITARDTSGAQFGIRAVNGGTGALSITSTGTAAGLAAISAAVGATGTDLSVIARDTFGGSRGIEAVNDGSGSLTIVSTGLASGLADAGIRATGGANSGNIAITARDTAGGNAGIAALQQGRGTVTITSSGRAAGALTGIEAVSEGAGVTINAQDTSGTLNAIRAEHRGTGSLSIASTGTASSVTGFGIFAGNGADGSDLTIVSNIASGQMAGIRAIGKGTGALAITTTGATTATAGSGIIASNAGTSLTIVANGLVSGSVDGIRATNTGTGGLSITGRGNVTGSAGVALRASNSANDTTASMVITQAAGTTWTGGSDGIDALNAGGSLTVNAGGTVIGLAGAGILAQNAATATLLTVNAANASGTTSGIDIRSLGSQGVVINLAGTAQGGTGAGIDTQTNAGPGASRLTTINLNQGAAVRAGTSGIAIRNNAGNSIVNMNAGSAITGAVRLGDGSDTFNVNDASLSLFGVILDGGDDVVGGDGWVDTLNFNNGWSGTLRGADVLNWEVINLNGSTLRLGDGALTTGALLLNGAARLDGSTNLVVTGAVGVAAPATLIAGSNAGNNVARVTGDVVNLGTIDLRGPTGTSAAGDRLTIGGNLDSNGTIRLDAALGSSVTDLLVVNGNLTGQSVLIVTAIGGSGSLTSGDGIRLVTVAGTSAPDALRLPGNALDVGAFRYGLTNVGGDWFLRSRTREIVIATMSIANVTQMAGLASIGTLNKRIGEQELLAADGGESGFLKGAWTRAFGSGFIDRSSSAAFGDGRSDGQYGGLQLGIDLFRHIAADGSRLHLGVLGGWLWTGSDEVMTRPMRMRSGSTRGDGWVAGAYLTYLSAADWYVDGAAQRQSLDQRATATDGTTLSTEAESWYGSIELGKAFGSTWKIEPQLQLVYGSTDFDSFADSAGIANRITVEDTLTGRAGLRLKRAWDHDPESTGGRFAVYAKANVWRQLSGGDTELGVGASAPGRVAFGRTWGDVGLGTTFSIGRNATFFADAEVEYGLDQSSTALSGRAGLNIRF